MRVIPGNVIVLEMSEDEATTLHAAIRTSIWRYQNPTAKSLRKATREECSWILCKLRDALAIENIEPDYEGMR